MGMGGATGDGEPQYRSWSEIKKVYHSFYIAPVMRIFDKIKINKLEKMGEKK